jgi:hypothetical protein
MSIEKAIVGEDYARRQNEHLFIRNPQGIGQVLWGDQAISGIAHLVVPPITWMFPGIRHSVRP